MAARPKSAAPTARWVIRRKNGRAARITRITPIPARGAKRSRSRRAAGALSTHNGKTYTYDAWDRLSGYTDGTASYTYKYDTDGLRTQKNDTQYVVDIHNNVIAEANESGSVTAETGWGHRPLARKVGDAWYYYLYNAHGDVSPNSCNAVRLYNENGLRYLKGSLGIRVILPKPLIKMSMVFMMT